MDIGVSVAWIITVLLVATRLSFLFFATPLDLIGRLPLHIKLIICLGLSLAFTMAIPASLYPQNLTLYSLVVSFLNEAVVGLSMAFGLYCAFAVMTLGGGLLDFQAGFGAANVLNPATNTYEPILGSVLTFIFIFVFFSSGALGLLLRGVFYSLQKIPPGEALRVFPLAGYLKQFGIMFTYGFAVAAPTVGVLLLVDTAIGVMSRSMPQMNVYFLFLPLKIAIALLAVGVSLHFLVPLMEQLLISVFRYWEGLL